MQDTKVHSIESAASFGDANNEAKYLLLLSKASSSHVKKLLSRSFVFESTFTAAKIIEEPRVGLQPVPSIKVLHWHKSYFESLKIISENVALIPRSSSELKHMHMEAFLFPAEFDKWSVSDPMISNVLNLFPMTA